MTSFHAANATTPLAIQARPSKAKLTVCTTANSSHIASSVSVWSLLRRATWRRPSHFSTCQPMRPARVAPTSISPQKICMPPRPSTLPTSITVRSVASLCPARLMATCAPITATTMKASTSGPTARMRRCRKASSSTVAGRLVIAQKRAMSSADRLGLRTSPQPAKANSISR